MRKNSIQQEIEIVLKSSTIDQNTVQEYRERLKLGNLIRDENPEDHFCVMFVPFDKKTGKVFLGHHKKANDWIPPGGHIEKNEIPVQAAVREVREELNIEILADQLKLFTLDYLDVSGPKSRCKMHWHIWYLLNTEETNYKLNTDEFYEVGWFGVGEVRNKVRILQYQKILLTFFI